jgi:hypothetical protein
MPQQRKLNDRANGIYGGPRRAFGQYLDSGIAQISGVTYGGQGLGEYWQNYPNIIGGMTEIDRKATETGSNLSAANTLSASQRKYYDSQTAINAGLDGAPTGSSVGGTAAY